MGILNYQRVDQETQELRPWNTKEVCVCWKKNGPNWVPTYFGVYWENLSTLWYNHTQAMLGFPGFSMSYISAQVQVLSKLCDHLDGKHLVFSCACHWHWNVVIPFLLLSVACDIWIYDIVWYVYILNMTHHVYTYLLLRIVCVLLMYSNLKPWVCLLVLMAMLHFQSSP
jgi:hypothetical protein